MNLDARATDFIADRVVDQAGGERAMAHDALEIDPANAEQAQAWDGDEGRYWAGNAERYDAAVSR
jgi:hypothetical protein